MTKRLYAQPCSVARALDRVGERWALLVVRELMLGPLRFGELARAVGGAPTDVLTKRLRGLEADGIVRRRALGPPASSPVYELTELGRGLEPALVALGRWGLNFLTLGDAAALPSSWLPNALRIVLQPPPDAALTIQLDVDDQAFRLRIEEGVVGAKRGRADDPDLTLTGSAGEIMSVLAESGGEGVLAELRRMVVVPDRLRAPAA